MTAMTVAAFRSLQPEFSDSVKYPDAAITRWLVLADKILPANRWEDWLETGTCWFAAHYLAIGRLNEQTSRRGSAVGAGGIVASKSLGQASVSYDTASGVEFEAGHWNLTTYGREFIRTARMVGTGGAQL